MARLRKRRRVWYATVRTNAGWVERSTFCTDKRAADLRAAEWERRAALGQPLDDDNAPGPTVDRALDLLLADRDEQATAGRRSKATHDFYQAKAWHLRAALGGKPLAHLRAADVDGYISARRAEGAAETTIHKELTTLRAALKLARRAELWDRDPASVVPIGFAPEYKPRTRVLAPSEAGELLAAFEPGPRRAAVAFMLATGARWHELERAQHGDIDTAEFRTVRLRGTKTAAAARVVPVVLPAQRWALAIAAANAGPGEPGALLFPAWGNVRRDLRAACARVGCLRSRCGHAWVRCTRPECAALALAPVSPNDLRRSFATWLRAAGAEPSLIAPAMGHVDSRMVERVYGRLSPSELAAQLAAQTGAVL